MVLFFVGEPGTTIRTFGPESDEVDIMMRKVDMMLGHLVEQMEVNKMYDKVNIVITGRLSFQYSLLLV